MTIPIYAYEKDDGLESDIQTSNSIAYSTEVSLNKDLVKPSFDLDFQHPEQAIANDLNQWDLHVLSSILVSVGWNKNDDVFEPHETWAARDTPRHKPINFMHNEEDVIGHMVNSAVLDSAGNVVNDESSLPDKFDIAVNGILYSKWANPELQSRMDDIIAGISQGKWFVSMECLFKNFDYAVITPDGEHKIVPRTEASSFLTKHLRLYGGSGEFQGHKLGRLLRDFTFSGKGIVSNPANPRSIIFNNELNNPFVGSQAHINDINVTNNSKEKDIMSDPVAEQLKQDLATANAKLDKLEAKHEEMIAKAQQAEKDKAEAEIAGLKVDVEDLTKEVADKKSVISEHEEAIAAFKKEAKAAQAKIDELTEQLSKSEAAKVKSNRVSSLVEAGLSTEEADEVADKWSEASEEQFEDVVALHKARVEAKMDDKDKKKKKADEDASKDDNDASASSDVDDAELEDEDDTALASDSDSEEDELQQSLASWISESLSNNETQE